MIAMLFWLCNSLMLLFEINSRFERNLNVVGQRLSWIWRTAKPMTAKDQRRSALRATAKYLLIVGLGFVSTFLSWVYVALQIGVMVHKFSSNQGTPESVKEFRWKLRNTDMTFEQIVRETMKASGADPGTFEECCENFRREMADRGLT